MYRAILWDNDGVLVETEKWYYEATKLVMEQEGYHLNIDEYRETFLKYNTGAWHLLENSDKNYINLLRNKRNSIYSTFLQTKDIYIEYLSKILYELKNKYKMGIVTTPSVENLHMFYRN